MELYYSSLTTVFFQLFLLNHDMKKWQTEELQLAWNIFCRAVNTTKSENQKKISLFLYQQLKRRGIIK